MARLGDGPPRTRPITVRGAAIVVLASLLPFVDFLGRNTDLVQSPTRALAFGATVASIAVALTAAVVARRRSPRPDAVAAGTAAAVLSTFNASALLGDETLPDPFVPVGLWLIATVLLVILVQRLARRPVAITFILVWLVLANALAASTWLSASRIEQLPPLAERSTIDDLPDAAAVRTPNIYWFMMDEYGRADQLRRVTGQDVPDIADDLEQRGFAVSRSSWSSYARTHLSLASTLSGATVARPGDLVSNDFFQLGSIAVGDNATVRRLREHGYRYVHSDPAGLEWLSCDPEVADICLPPARRGLALDEHDESILRRTPLGQILPTTRPSNDPIQVLDALDERRGEIDGPFFLFAHVLSPHGPFRFHADCTVRSSYLVTPQLSQERIDAYVEELPCVNAVIAEAVDRIQAEDPGAIIIVQSDHGSALKMEVTFSFEHLTDDHIQERYAVVNAMYLPEPCSVELEGRPLLDTFHIVFGCIEDRPARRVPWAAYYYPGVDFDRLTQLDASRFGPAPPSGAASWGEANAAPELSGRPSNAP